MGLLGLLLRHRPPGTPVAIVLEVLPCSLYDDIVSEPLDLRLALSRAMQVRSYV
jgi:hypothetical protein